MGRIHWAKQIWVPGDQVAGNWAVLRDDGAAAFRGPPETSVLRTLGSKETMRWQGSKFIQRPAYPWI